MTAVTATPVRVPRLGLLVPLVLAAVLVGIAGRVLLSSHATDRHALDAPQIRHCIQRNGPAEIWPHHDDDSVESWLCQLPDGRWCIQIVQHWPSLTTGTDWRERTAFCPADGTYRRVVDYLYRFARRAS